MRNELSRPINRKSAWSSLRLSENLNKRKLTKQEKKFPVNSTWTQVFLYNRSILEGVFESIIEALSLTSCDFNELIKNISLNQKTYLAYGMLLARFAFWKETCLFLIFNTVVERLIVSDGLTIRPYFTHKSTQFT